MRLLLVSSSCPYGRPYFSNCAEEIRALFSGVKRVLFIPYGGYDQIAYGQAVAARLKELSFELDLLPEGKAALAMVKKAEAIYIGGGNTFRLLFKLQANGLMSELRKKILAGVPYLGPSAGAVLACPTIQTTNTLATLWPTELRALDLVPFFIVPHYTPTNLITHTTGETREERIEEFLEENDKVVLAMGEDCFISVSGKKMLLKGADPAFVFRRGLAPVRLDPEVELSLPILKI